MAARRLRLIEDLAPLPVTDAASELAKGILHFARLPAKAAEDALHIAIATVHGVDFLLTWNCKHIANAILVRKVAELCERRGQKCPVICTPPELSGQL